LKRNNPDIGELTEKLKRLLLERAKNKKIPCAVARALAEQYEVPYKLIGQLADELEIKIINCELGCF